MGAALLREETEAKPVRSRRSLPSLPEAALVPAPSGLAPLAAYFSCSYLKGEAFGDGSYVTILEEVCQHSVERFVEFFDHQPSHIRVWSEVLDLRLAQPNMAAMVLFHYTTRDGLWSLLDYQQPIGEAMKALAEKAALATREPSQLAAVDPRLRYCLPLLVPQSCCKGPVDRSPNDMLITFGDKELQCANMHGWTCLRPKRLERPCGVAPEDFWRSLGEYGAGLFMAGHIQPALQTCRQAFDGICSQSGHLHPESLRLQHNLAAVCRHAGLHVDAEMNFRRVWNGRSQTLGQNHPTTLRSLCELATVVGQCRPKDAQELYRLALKGKQAYYGVSHPETVSSMINLAYSLWKDGSQSEAEDLYRRALLIAESTLGPKHPTTLHCLNNLAVMAKELGRAGELGRLLGRRPGNGQSEGLPITTARIK